MATNDIFQTPIVSQENGYDAMRAGRTPNIPSSASDGVPPSFNSFDMTSPSVWGSAMLRKQDRELIHAFV